MHQKRNKIGRFWAVPRKGTKYLAVSAHNQKTTIPLVVVMREILGLVRNKKELQKVINEKQIEINGKQVRDTSYPIGLFDIISIKSLNKNYRAVLAENKKNNFEEVPDSEVVNQTVKIIGKKVIGKDKLQLNLMGGGNVISKEDVKVDDSVVYNFKDRKVERVVKMEKGNQGYVIRGKHAGVKGKIEDIMERGGKKLAVVDDGNNKINVWVKNIIVMEK